MQGEYDAKSIAMLLNGSELWGPHGYRSDRTATHALETGTHASSALISALSSNERACLVDIQAHLDRHRVSLRQAFHPFAAAGMSVARMAEVLPLFGPVPDDLAACLRAILHASAADDATISIDKLLQLIEDGREPFVFIIPSYNNADNLNVNLCSVRAQAYPPRLSRIIYLDDNSSDATLALAAEYIVTHGMQRQSTLLHIPRQQGPGYSRFIAHHRTWDDEIAVMLDGDDWLFDSRVLEQLEALYQQQGALVSYGGFYVYGSDAREVKAMQTTYGSYVQCAHQMPEYLLKSRNYAKGPWVSCHLRSMRAVTLKAIEARHLLGPDGRFARVASDRMQMIPVLQMSGRRLAINNATMFVRVRKV